MIAGVFAWMPDESQRGIGLFITWFLAILLASVGVSSGASYGGMFSYLWALIASGRVLTHEKD